MRAALALGLLLLAGGAAARTPFQARCEDSLPRAAVHWSVDDGGSRIDNTLTTGTLSAMKGHVPGTRVLGLTRTEARVTLALRSARLQDAASGYECIAPQIAATLRYLPVVVYVGSEFAPGTCAYREVLAHEERHLRAYRDFLPQAQARLRSLLAARFDGQPLYAPAGQAGVLLQRELDGRWMPQLRAVLAEVERVQAAIDTPQEYARLSKVCAGEVQSLLESARRARP